MSDLRGQDARPDGERVRGFPPALVFVPCPVCGAVRDLALIGPAPAARFCDGCRSLYLEPSLN